MAKKIIVNGYAYSWRDLRHRLDRVRIRLPQAMADAARNFFVDSFTKQGWDTGHGIKKWKPSKKSDGRRRRAILVKTGRLRKSIRIRHATFRRITIAAEAPYAAAHNFGVDETVTVRAHTRRTYGRVQEKYTTSSGKERTRTKRVETGSHIVRSHTRHMQLPQRQFMGDSQMLDQKLDRIVERAVEEIFDI